ncbi:type II toxin-antitoxin system RelE/ParE family toxin [Xanthobacter autotrophicus]|uniref:type II toxin-antitoxin system RelE/ParE family toxin n=1 Tax=Xanthobacter autotrophicus TaxID=280 RepID=UPI003726FB87
MAAVRSVKVQFTPVAQQDLAAILAYLRQHSPVGMRHVGSTIHQTIRLLAAEPFMGRPGVLPGAREFIVRGYPYIIAYEVDETRRELSIVSVIHTARQRP